MPPCLVFYHFPPRTPRRILVSFHHRFFGRRVSVHGGRYTYRYAGFLDRFGYTKVQRGVLEVATADGPAILAYLRQAGAIARMR
jgi:hypothetical protein